MNPAIEELLARVRRDVNRMKRFYRRLDTLHPLYPVSEVFQNRSPRLFIGMEQPDDPLRHYTPVRTSRQFTKAGADALVVTTDPYRFGGSMMHLESIKNSVDVPVIRRDLIIDEIQLDETMDSGGDGVVLLPELLSPDRLQSLVQYARRLHLDPILEISNPADLPLLRELAVKLVIINNQGFLDRQTNLSRALEILPQLPADCHCLVALTCLNQEYLQQLVAGGCDALFFPWYLFSAEQELKEVSASLKWA